MTAPWILAALPGLLGGVVGAAYGFIAQRGAFCLNSGLRSAFAAGDGTKVKAFAVAIGIQMIALPIVFRAGVVEPRVPSFFVAGAIVGGLLFGASMRWAAGCAAGVLFKIGGRSSSAIPAAIGMVVGAGALELGPLTPVRDLLRGPEVVTRAALGLDVGGAGGVLLVAVGALLLVAVWRTTTTKAGAWTWRRTGVLLGVVATLAWVLSGVVGRDFGLAVIPGAVGIAGALRGQAAGLPVFDAALVAGIVAGAALAARGSTFARLTVQEVMKRFAGGLGLGAGASIAAGCTMGHGLAGLPLLAPGSIVAMVAIFLGVNLAPLFQRGTAGRAAGAVSS